ncbi:Hpt domain-containing protein [soil metagenome]
MARPQAKQKSQALKVETFADHSVITQPNPLKRYIRQVDADDRDDPVGRAEQALEKLSLEFKDWMAVECDRLLAAHDALLGTGVSAATRDELFRAAHDIRGDAATFGFPTAGAAAESLCRIIEHAPDFNQVPPDLIAHHVNAIQAIVREQAQIDRVGMAHELSDRLRHVADDYLMLANRDRPDYLEAIMSPGLVPRD